LTKCQNKQKIEQKLGWSEHHLFEVSSDACLSALFPRAILQVRSAGNYVGWLPFTVFLDDSTCCNPIHLWHVQILHLGLANSLKGLNGGEQESLPSG